MTTSVNGTLTAIEDAAKALVYDPLALSAEAALFAALPWLNIWPINPIVRGILNYYKNYYFDQARMFTDVGAITLLNNKHQADYDAASIKLRVIAADKGSASPEYQKARDDAKAAFLTFIKFNR